MLFGTSRNPGTALPTRPGIFQLPYDVKYPIKWESQEAMEKLKLLVENYLEEKYCYPDVLYSFMDKVLDDKTE